MGYIRSWRIEYLKGEATGEQPLFEIAPRLYQSPRIRKPQIVRDAGIKVVIDLEGSFDDREISDFLAFYLYWPIRDVPELPDLHQLGMVAAFAEDCRLKENKVLVH